MSGMEDEKNVTFLGCFNLGEVVPDYISLDQHL